MTKRDLEISAKILGWSSVFGLLIVTVWFGIYLSGAVCSLHMPMFNLTLHECELFSYGGLAITKILVIVFLVLPWLAIKLVLRKELV